MQLILSLQVSEISVNLTLWQRDFYREERNYQYYCFACIHNNTDHAKKILVVWCPKISTFSNKVVCTLTKKYYFVVLRGGHPEGMQQGTS